MRQASDMVSSQKTTAVKKISLDRVKNLRQGLMLIFEQTRLLKEKHEQLRRDYEVKKQGN